MTCLRSNLWKVYGYGFLSEFYLIAPILIPFYVANGLGPTQVFAVQATYSIAVLFLEIPSGYLADVIGRKRALVLGGVLMPMGIAVYAVSRTFAAFVAAELLIAVAQSMRSGTDSALIFDSLREVGEEREYQRFEGRSQFFARLGGSAAAVAGGLLALTALRLPFRVNAATAALMLPLALSIREPRRGRLRAIEPLRTIVRVAGDCFRHPRLRWLIAAHAVTHATGITGVWASFLYYDAVGIGVGWYGLLFAGLQLASALGAACSESVRKALGERLTLVLLPLIGASFVVLGVGRSVSVLPVIALYAFLWGSIVPLLFDGMNRLITSETRATALSVANMARSLGFAVVGPLFGAAVGRWSLGSALVGLGAFHLVGGFAVLVPLLRREPRQPPMVSAQTRDARRA